MVFRVSWGTGRCATRRDRLYIEKRRVGLNEQYHVMRVHRPLLLVVHSRVVGREANAHIHESIFPLSRSLRLEDLGALKTKEKAMLIFIAPAVNEDLTKVTGGWQGRLDKIFYSACDTSCMLHPEGTVVVHVPNPYFTHATRLAGNKSKEGRHACFCLLLSSKYAWPKR